MVQYVFCVQLSSTSIHTGVEQHASQAASVRPQRWRVRKCGHALVQQGPQIALGGRQGTCEGSPLSARP